MLRGASLVQLQAGVHLLLHGPGSRVRDDGREEAGSVRDVP